MNISLPEQLKDFIDEQVGTGRYSSASEYVRELVRGDEKRRERDKLEALLLAGLESGPATEMTKQDWRDIRSEGLQLLEGRQKKLKKSVLK